MRPADQTSWWDFAKDLADEGYLVLTYDFRGYCPGGDGGCSEGEQDLGAIWQDVRGGDRVHPLSRGASGVVLIGASMGGTASLVAAAQDGVDVDVVVTLSAPAAIEGMDADADVLTRVIAAKLFIAGARGRLGRRGRADALRRVAAAEAGRDPHRPTTTAPTSWTGTSPGRARTLILTYLEQYSSAVMSRPDRLPHRLRPRRWVRRRLPRRHRADRAGRAGDRPHPPGRAAGRAAGGGGARQGGAVHAGRRRLPRGRGPGRRLRAPADRRRDARRRAARRARTTACSR